MKLKMYYLVYIINLFIFTIYLNTLNMKSSITHLLLLIALAIGSASLAQNDPTLNQQKEAMKSLGDFMVGSWKGSGWTKNGQNPTSTFNSEETIEYKNGGITLLIQGASRLAESNELIHDALAIMYYDVGSNTYQFDSHLANGQHKVMVGTLTNNVFVWGFELPNNAAIRYTTTFKDDTWNEVGEYTPDKVQYFKFFEMNLNKL